MTEDFQMKTKLTRRSLLSGAVTLGGGVALSTVAPSFVPATKPAAAEIVPDQEHLPIAASEARNTVESAADSTETVMKFSTKFLSNKVFKDLALNFDSPSPVRIDAKTVETGALVRPNGDISFRVYAPNAKDVTLTFNLVRDGKLQLTKQGSGVFEGLLPFDVNHTGPMGVEVNIDGVAFIDPFMPIHWSGGRPRNFIEVPDTDLEFMHIKDVPHGAMSREIYWADVIKSWERCVIYTPPGHMKSSKEYPVLYLLHGGGENEIVWEYCGRVAHILDNLIATGKSEPFIAVMNNGMLRYSDTANNVVDDAFERMLTESCIPHIEKNYRVKTDKWNRAIAGLSMGSYMACDIGFKRPDLFGNIGTFTASMTHETLHMSYERPYPTVMKDPQAFARNYRIYFRSTTPVEDHFADYFVAVDKFPSYHRIVYPKRTTKWNSWRMGLRDFAQLLFR
jgi:enterochelin esterase family protein